MSINLRTKKITELPTVTSTANGDFLVIEDVSTSNTSKISVQNFANNLQIPTATGSWGRMNLVTPVQTTITTQGVWVKAAGVTELAEHSYLFEMPENNRLKCLCTRPSIMEVSAVLSIVNGNNKTFEAAIAKNGTILDDTIRTFRLGSGGDVEEAVILGDFVKEPDDYVEVFIRNMTDTTDATVSRLYMRARTFIT